MILTEAQVQALEKKKQDDLASGEIETAHPGYLGSQDTFYVGTLKGVGRIYQQSFVDAYNTLVKAMDKLTAAGNAEGGGGGVKIEVVNALTGKANPLYRNSTAEAQNTNLNIDETISYLFTGAAKKYYIRITIEASAAGKLTASATMNAAQFNFVKDIRKNLIAPNGVAVVKGSSNYAVFTGDIFEVLIGKAGLRIQNGYVYKRDTDHTTWTKI